MYISKKDLLAMTGISYGQLYRWKREQLIPEEWFIKQSSYTGQETFFPREQILSRIRSILELKDQYSLEELAKMLSPEVTKGAYHQADLSEITEIDGAITSLLLEIGHKDAFDYTDLLVLMVATQMEQQLHLSMEELKAIITSITVGIRQAKTLELTIGVMEYQQNYFSYVIATNSYYYIDNQMKEMFQAQLLDYSNQLKMKYHHKFR